MTHIWRRFRRLDRGDRRLLGEALLLLSCARIGLHALPLPALRAALARPDRARALCHEDGRAETLCHPPPVAQGFRPVGRRSRSVESVDRVTWAVQRASVAVPGATCLVKALAADAMLRRRGHSALLRIGVRHATRTKVDAHAWVECDGRVVIGRVETISDYAVMS